MKKRVLAMLLAGMMVFTMTPAEAFATELPEQAEESQEETELENADLEDEEAQPEENADLPEEDKEIESDETEEAQQIEEENSEETEAQQTEAVNPEEEETQQTEEAKSEEEEAQQEESPEDRAFPVGGLEKPKAIEIPEEVVQTLDIQYGEEDGISAEGSQKYDSSWDIYSSNYIYNRLNSKEKVFWDALDTVCKKYLTTNVDGEKWVDRWTDEESAHTKEAVAYGNLGITSGRVREIYSMFLFSNPQYYFLDNGYMVGTYAGTYVMAPTFYKAFKSGAKRAEWTSKVKSQITSWVSKVSKGSNEVQKAKIAHDLIIKKVKYDSGFVDSNTKTPYHQSAFSVFCKDYTVCAGYTKAFAILMNGAGVDTMGVTSETHAWNKISIYDSWYNIDLTWDDFDGREIYNGQELCNLYFNRSDAMLTGELDDNVGTHYMESMYSGVVPKCTLDSGIADYDPNNIGTYKKPTVTVKTPTITLDKSSKKNIKVTLKSESGADIYYTMDGIKPSSSYSRSYRYKKPFTISSNVTLKVIGVKDKKKDSKIISKKVYGKVRTVTFNSQKGSKVSSKKVYTNDKMKKPSNPKRSGYVFVGWYKDSKCKTAWNFDSKVTKNITLYAKWTKKYTVKFDANGGSVKTKSKGVGYKKKYGTLPAATKKGYSFSGWYTKKSGGSKITKESKVTIKKTTTLYAHWKKVSVGKTAVSGLTNTSGKKMAVTIKKVSGAKGYQIQYSIKSNMKSAKTATTSGTKKTITKLVKGKKYYVRVRAYKVDSTGKKIYGAWSSKKSVKIKK